MKSAACRECGAPIAMVVNRKGRCVPVDADRVAEIEAATARGERPRRHECTAVALALRAAMDGRGRED